MVLLPAASLAHQVKFPVLQLLVFKTMVVLTAPCAQSVPTSLHSVWVIAALTAQLAGSKAKLVNPTALLAQLVFQALQVHPFAHHAALVNTATTMQSSVVHAELAQMATLQLSTVHQTAPSALMVSRMMQQELFA